MIQPKILKGFRDFLPRDEIRRALLIEKVTGVFRNAGFVPIDTPALEYSEVLLPFPLPALLQNTIATSIFRLSAITLPKFGGAKNRRLDGTENLSNAILTASAPTVPIPILKYSK